MHQLPGRLPRRWLRVGLQHQRQLDRLQQLLQDTMPRVLLQRQRLLLLRAATVRMLPRPHLPVLAVTVAMTEPALATYAALIAALAIASP